MIPYFGATISLTGLKIGKVVQVSTVVAKLIYTLKIPINSTHATAYIFYNIDLYWLYWACMVSTKRIETVATQYESFYSHKRANAVMNWPKSSQKSDENQPKWLKIGQNCQRILTEPPKIIFFRTKLGFNQHKYNPYLMLLRKKSNAPIK